MIFSLRDLSRRQRARVYIAALTEPTADFALDAALEAAARTGLQSAAARMSLASDAVHYAIACHGLVDPEAARVAVSHLNRGFIVRPVVVIREARRNVRRCTKATQASLSERFSLHHSVHGATA